MHNPVVFNLRLTKQPNVTKTIKYKPLAKINHGEFNNDLKESVLVCNPLSDLTMLVSIYHTELSNLLDKHAPFKTKTIVKHVGCKCFPSELSEFKCHLSSLEHKSKASGLTVDKEIQAEKSKEYEALRSKTKQLYHTNAMLDCAGDQGPVFSIINRLLHRTSSMPLPEAESNLALASDFAVFCDAKIAKIHDHLSVAP